MSKASVASKETVGRKRGSRKKGEVDGLYLILLCALTCAGLLMLISAGTPESVTSKTPYSGIIKNCIIAAGSFAVMLFVANFKDYMFLKKWSSLMYWASVILVYLTPLVGEERLGATRWIFIGPISIQPTEIMKIALIIYLADILTQEKRRSRKNMTKLQRLLYEWREEIIIVIPAAGAALQKHLSGALIICAIGFTMLFAYGMKKSHIFIIGSAGIAAFIGLIIVEPFRMKRIFGYMHPENEPLGYGWQILNSLYAICSGGLFGVGFGQSRQKYSWLPMASNDYIFAVICEEMGIFGGLVVLLMFVLFVWRGIKIALNSRDMFGSMIAFGVSAMIGLQVVINIAVVTNAVPSTGMQLPFFSSGGTSLLFMLAATGLVLNISRYQKVGAGLIHTVK